MSSVFINVRVCTARGNYSPDGFDRGLMASIFGVGVLLSL